MTRTDFDELRGLTHRLDHESARDWKKDLPSTTAFVADTRKSFAYLNKCTLGVLRFGTLELASLDVRRARH